ncbi:MAG: DNA cytosine methyltransferase [Candidatus Sumerlaeota bacterium]|nr:DNA cytosine methyltransferase [Candidatus Sumerlaeota bacterium]
MEIADKSKFIGVDLFAGAGGLSLGAQMAGIDVKLAIEKDPHAAATYKRNHPQTRLIVEDIANVRKIDVPKDGKISVLFGGPPCQGFSTSNQRTRTRENPSNWLFKDFIRLVRNWEPDWIVFENVRGIIETERGLFLRTIVDEFEEAGYTCAHGVLCASDFCVPQIRSRFFLIGSRHGTIVEMPKPIVRRPVTVRQAIEDLPSLCNGASEDYLRYPRKPRSNYAKAMRNGQDGCHGHLVTSNASNIIERYRYIPQGGNWENIPKRLMNNYTNRARCHTGIYRRLDENFASIVLGNYRKNMLVHPREDRGLSIREAARLQSFPDRYEFTGSIGFQQQQVANAVPPLLAKAVFQALV